MQLTALTDRSPAKIWLLLPVVLLLIQISPIAYLSPDAISYLSMAQSLSQTGVMLNQGSPHLTYAVGWPILLSVVYRLPLDPILGASLLNVLLGMIYLAGVWTWCRRVCPRIAVWITCLAVCNATVTHLFRRPLSEPLFMCLLTWGTYALQMLTERLRTRLDWTWLGSCCLLLTMLSITRQVGVFLVAGWGLQLGFLVWQRQIPWKQSLLALTCVSLCSGGAVLGFILYDQHTKAVVNAGSNWDMLVGKSHFAADYQYEGLADHTLEGLRVRIYEVGRLVIPGMFGCYAGTGDWLNINTFIYVPLTLLCCVGWWRFIRRHADAFSLMAPIYVAFYIYWPSNQDGRFFTPLLPLLYVCLWKACTLFPSSRHRSVFPVLIIAHTVVALVLWLILDYRDNILLQDEWNKLPSVRWTG